MSVASAGDKHPFSASASAAVWIGRSGRRGSAGSLTKCIATHLPLQPLPHGAVLCAIGTGGQEARLAKSAKKSRGGTDR